jgi:hypothetical protein
MEERRGRPKEIIQQPQETKFSRVYEDEYTIETWKFDLNKFSRGPIEVDIKYKAGAEKALKLKAKEAKQTRKNELAMNRINRKNNK